MRSVGGILLYNIFLTRLLLAADTVSIYFWNSFDAFVNI